MVGRVHQSEWDIKTDGEAVLRLIRRYNILVFICNVKQDHTGANVREQTKPEIQKGFGGLWQTLMEKFQLLGPLKISNNQIYLISLLCSLASPILSIHEKKAAINGTN